MPVSPLSRLLLTLSHVRYFYIRLAERQNHNFLTKFNNFHLHLRYAYGNNHQSLEQTYHQRFHTKTSADSAPPCIPLAITVLICLDCSCWTFFDILHVKHPVFMLPYMPSCATPSIGSVGEVCCCEVTLDATADSHLRSKL